MKEEISLMYKDEWKFPFQFSFQTEKQMYSKRQHHWTKFVFAPSISFLRQISFSSFFLNNSQIASVQRPKRVRTKFNYLLSPYSLWEYCGYEVCYLNHMWRLNAKQMIIKFRGQEDNIQYPVMFDFIIKVCSLLPFIYLS